MNSLAGVLFCAACVLLSPRVLAGDVLPPLSPAFSYQGWLRENGQPVDGNFDLRFTLYETETATVPAAPALVLPDWPVVDGLVVAELAFEVPFDGDQRWLELAVDGVPILPRQPVLAAPVAQFALDTVLDGEVSGSGRNTTVSGARVGAEPDSLVRRDASGAIAASIVRADLEGNADSATVADSTVDFTGVLMGDVGGTQGATEIQPGAVSAGMIAPDQVVRSIGGLRDDVGISGSGTVSVAAGAGGLMINGSGIEGVTAGSGLLGGGSAGTVGLSVNFGGSGSGSSAARSDHVHIGQIWSAPDRALQLQLQTTATDTQVLNVFSNSLTGFNGGGVYSQMLSSTGSSVGVLGGTSSSDPDAAGVFGQATAAGAAKGIWGFGSAAGTFGVVGQGANGGLAGAFFGNVQVNGTLSKAAGSFRIDHPLDPENRYLYHSFVESPDMKNIYDGVVVLDDNGSASVRMPDWFDALNRDFRYQLTAIGAPMPDLHVARKLLDRSFLIDGGVPGAEVSWQLTGIRQDAYAEQNRIPGEQDKPPSERGRYLHPEAFGRAAHRGIAPEAGPRGLD